jgi:GNAT superfamily N-acetyltransferase
VATALLTPNLPGLGNHVADAVFMVDPDLANGDVGRLLAEDVIDRAVDLGYRAMQFNAVVATNSRVVALWRSLAFRVVGTVPAGFRHPWLGDVDLYVMHRFLPARSEVRVRAAGRDPLPGRTRPTEKPGPGENRHHTSQGRVRGWSPADG